MTNQLPTREMIAKAIHARRYHLDAKDTESMFAWYAEKPHGTDRSRVAIYSALQDADAVLALFHHETCTSCMGSGISNHPDSNETCDDCKGRGAIPALPATAT